MNSDFKDIQILEGDCIKSMRSIPDGSINCCVTSPPYFGLRDYGHKEQIGQESSADIFVNNLVNVFKEVKRVLREDGTLWLNLGDSYFSKSLSANNNLNLKHKDLIGIPWMVAFALRNSGWHLRQDIIWHKPNPMPEAVKDRCTKSHEYIFLLTKSSSYFYDEAAIREPWKQNKSDIKRAKEKHPGYAAKHSEGYNGNVKGQPVGDPSKGRNKRSVWTVSTRPYKEAHFATFPPDLITPCILAGCPEGGIVLDPFGGSGTTAEVAIKNRRKAILCELNSDYIRLIKQRIDNMQINLI